MAFLPLLQPLPDVAWRSWNWDPILLLGLLLGALLYARGLKRLWQRAGAGRSVTYTHALSFAAGWLVLFVALVSPVDAIGEALLAAHMVQHLLLTLVAAPLLVAGMPPVALGWSVPHSGDVARWWHRRAKLLRAIWRVLSRPGVAWSVQILVLWSWHLPVFYQAALLNEWIHILEHLSFLGAALLFWWTIVPRRSEPQRLSVGAGALYVFTTALLSGLLGVLLTFSEEVWYPAYGIVSYGWGLTPLQDQQLAGVIIWFPGGLAYLVALMLLLGSELQRGERPLVAQPAADLLEISS